MLGDPIKLTKLNCILISGLLWWLSDNESACNAGDLGSVPGSGRSPGEGNGNSLQYSCLENPMATHSNILAWRIPWIEEPGRLESMGSQRVGYDLVTKQQQNLLFRLMMQILRKRN